MAAKSLYVLLALNLSTLIVAFVAVEEMFYIGNSRPGVVTGVDAWGFYLSVAVAWLGWRRWISFAVLVGLLYITAIFSYEIWMTEAGVYNSYPVSVYFVAAVVFLISALCLALVIVERIVRAVVGLVGSVKKGAVDAHPIALGDLGRQADE